MAFDPVPFAVGGGAEHSAEVFRTMAFTATGGAEGIAEPNDMKVTALSTPGAAVQVLPGSVLVRSRATGGSQQSYVARNVSATSVSVAATGSGAGRSDLVAVLIKDPFMAGEPWPTPSNPAVGPYVEAVIISNVPAGTTRLQAVSGHANTTGYAVARLDIPASTGTITNAMVKDLRKMPAPRSLRSVKSIPQGGGTAAGTVYNGLASSSFGVWPPTATWDVDVPEWATHAVVVVTISAYSVKRGNTAGQLKITMSGNETVLSSFDENYTGNPHRGSVTIAGEIPIPLASRGTPDLLRVMGKRTSSTADGVLDADGYTSTIVDLQFVERVV